MVNFLSLALCYDLDYTLILLVVAEQNNPNMNKLFSPKLDHNM